MRFETKMKLFIKWLSKLFAINFLLINLSIDRLSALVGLIWLEITVLPERLNSGHRTHYKIRYAPRIAATYCVNEARVCIFAAARLFCVFLGSHGWTSRFGSTLKLARCRGCTSEGWATEPEKRTWRGFSKATGRYSKSTWKMGNVKGRLSISVFCWS